MARIGGSPRTPDWFGGPKAMNASDLITYVKGKGGFIMVPHYNNRQNEQYGGIGFPYNYTQLRDWGADSFEIVNGGGLRDAEIREFCLDNNLACISTTDMHTNQPINAFVKIKLDPNNLTVANIFATLKKNTHQAIAVDLNPNNFDIVPEFFKDLEFGFIEKFIEYLMNLDSFQVLSWICWSIIGFLFISIVYRKAKKLDVETLRRKIL